METYEENNDQLPESNEEQQPVDSQEVEAPIAPTSMGDEQVPVEIERANYPASYASLSQSELVEKLKEIMAKPIDQIEKDEVDTIKQLFYKKQKSDLEQQKKLFLESGGTEDTFVAVKSEDENEFKALLQTYREQRVSIVDVVEKEKEDNFKKKLAMLDQLKVLAEAGDVGESLPAFRKLQQEWKSVGQVPLQKVNELWKAYNSYMERFYDLIKINNEMRDYDFKKNLEQKTALCEAAEKLINEKDVVQASRQLQKLHDEWRETGPVARELREDLWMRFKTASSAINRKHQEFFVTLKTLEDDNLKAKKLLCEQVATIDFALLKSYKEWEAKTTEVINCQKKWKAIGFAPRKENTKIYTRFRNACDTFFKQKSEFMKTMKSELDDNYEKKKALCEKAESLKESQDWKETTQIMIDIQKEWKTIGPIAKKYSDVLWKRFVTACDYFFERKETQFSSKKSEEMTNLTMKKALIEKVNTFTAPDNVDECLAKIREFIAEWNAIGFVPFKDKDRIFNAFKNAVSKRMDELNIDSVNRKLISFRDNIEKMTEGGARPNQLYRERERLLRAYDNLKNEITTYENNIGFISAKSKKSDTLVQELERKIEKLKEDHRLIEQKIKMIDENL